MSLFENEIIFDEADTTGFECEGVQADPTVPSKNEQFDLPVFLLTESLHLHQVSMATGQPRRGANCHGNCLGECLVGTRSAYINDVLVLVVDISRSPYIMRLVG